MNLFRAISAVAGGLIGIRRGEQARKDLSELKPWHIIATAVLAVALFVIALVALVSHIAG